MLRDGRADVALMQRPFHSLAGFDTEDLLTEEQVAILPAGHPLATRTSLTMADISDLADLPLARWPCNDGAYPPGPGPEIHDQSQLAQLIALGHTVAVTGASARSWLWNAHVAVPLTGASPVTTVLAWPAHSRSPAVAGLVRTAAHL
jgi:DNA-binding transcriptional LysR family regulator